MDDRENTCTHNLIHTYGHTHMYACTKPVYIFMFVDIFCMRAIRESLGKKLQQNMSQQRMTLEKKSEFLRLKLDTFEKNYSNIL